MRENDELTAAVLARLDGAAHPRFAEVMRSLVEHLHAFAREVRLDEGEWLAGVRFLTAVGQTCDERRQETILLSDVLGLSMLVDALAHRAGGTESTVLGPFFVEGAPGLENGADLAAGEAGEPMRVRGTVRAVDGAPIAGARVDVWQADAAGRYDVQSGGATRLRGWLRTDEEGRFWFRTVKPCSYPVPVDGPVGRLLDAMGRHPYRPAHVHFMLRAAGHQRLVTHLFVAGDEYLASDAVFGVKDPLVVDVTRGETGDLEMSYEFVLQ